MKKFSVLAIDIDDKNASTLFAKSLRETGFAILKNHSISTEIIDEMYASWAAFFASDNRFDFAAKKDASDGYFGFKSENAKGNTHKDLKEFFHIYEDKVIPREVEMITRDFYKKMLGIGEIILGWLDKEIPVELGKQLSEPFVSMIDKSQSHLLRVIHYPPLPDDVAPGETRAGAHEDIDLITLLVTGSQPGLQAQDVDGNWHDVPCQAGYITVNAGDMLAQASRGHYPSTCHRVINPPVQENKSRYSMPLFIHPRPEVMLNYQTAGEYLDERLAEIRL